MKRNLFISSLILLLLSACATKKPPTRYDKLSYGEFSALLFKNENYLAMQQPCKTFNLRFNNEKAIHCYQLVARSNPDSPEAQYLLAMAYLHAGDAVRTKQQALIIEKQSLDFLRLTFHAVANKNRAFIRAFKFEPRWLSLDQT